MPSRRLSSAASIQSSRAVPGGVIFRATVLMRPSMLVVVPSTSAGPAAASTTSACWADAREEAIDGDHRAGPGEGAGGQVGVGEVGERDRRRAARARRPCRGGGVQDPGGIEAAGGWGPSATRARGTSRAPSARVVRPGRQPGCEPHVERAVHVAAAQGAEEAHLGMGGVDGRRRGDDAVGRLGEVGSTEDHGDGPVGEEGAGRGDGVGLDATHLLGRRAGEQRSHDLAGGARAVQQRGGGQLGHRRALRGELDDGDAVADDRVAEAQEEDRQLLLEVGGEEQDGAARGADLVDRGAGEAEHELGGKPVAELGVDVVGADDALGQLGPGVGALVGEPGAAEHGDLVGGGGSERVGGRRQRLAPGHLDEASRPGGRAGGRGAPRC